MSGERASDGAEVHLKLEGAATPRTWVLRAGDLALIGSGPGMQLELPGLAPRHAAVRVEQDAVQAVCFGVGATLVNGAPLAKRAPTDLRSGDLLQVGAHRVRVNIVGGRQRRGQARRTARLESDGVPRDRYEPQGEIGRGAFGRVYAAVRKQDGRKVAIKVLLEAAAATTEARERFVREGQLAARLRSPFVVEVHEVLEEQGRVAIVMELVEGPSARDLIARGRVAVADALRIGLDVAQALSLAAQQGIVHRDVKPANILVSKLGCAKLTDFGMAKDLEATVRCLTVTGQGLGSLAYMPPEQLALAKHVDPRADVYSLGATLYHLLAGRPPYEPTSTDSLQALLSLAPPPLPPDCPRDVVACVERLLSRGADARPAPWEVPPQLRALLERHAPGATFDALFGGRA